MVVTQASSELQTQAEALRELIQQQALFPLFQPIIDTLSGELLGHEALIRGPRLHPLEMPRELFRVAHKAQLLSELEIACRAAALRDFAKFRPNSLLFINVNPNVLLEQDHPRGSTLQLAQQLQLDPAQIVIELSEQYPIDHPQLLKEAIERYRQAGFLIAIDDLGAGYSGLKLWSELRPDYVKIDRYFIADIHRDPVKREFVQSIIALARAMQARVIAEGIESAGELRQLQQLGVYLCQGYHLGRPAVAPMRAARANQFKTQPSRANAQYDTIGQLLEQVPTTTPTTPALEVLDLFTADANLLTLPVVSQGRTFGVVRRESLMELFSGSYGRALYANKPVTHIMDQRPLVVDAQTTLEAVSQFVTEDLEIDISRHLIITQNGDYAGVASVRNLLRTITDLRIQNARYANPLTQLPGNVPIYREVDQWLQSDKPFRVAYFDLNNFKPYNDVYGYGQGDRILQWVANLLTEELASHGHFIGHIGGDDFVALFADNSDWRAHCDQLIRRFDSEIQQFYTAADLARGGIDAPSRNQQMAFFPLLGIAVGVIKPDRDFCHSHHDVASLASVAKKEAKQFERSYCHVSKRRRPEAAPAGDQSSTTISSSTSTVPSKASSV